MCYADCPSRLYVLHALAGLQDVDEELRRECSHFMAAYVGPSYPTVNKLNAMNVARHKPAQPDATIDPAHQIMFEAALKALQKTRADDFSADLERVKQETGWKTVGEVRAALLNGTLLLGNGLDVCLTIGLFAQMPP